MGCEAPEKRNDQLSTYFIRDVNVNHQRFTKHHYWNGGGDKDRRRRLNSKTSHIKDGAKASTP